MEKVEVTPVIGLPQLAGWSHVVINRSRTVTFSLAISGQHASNVGRDLVDELEQLSVDSVAALYATLTKLQREVSEKNCLLHLAAAMVLEGKGVFLATRGLIVLHRDGKLGKILQASDTLQVVEGVWKSDDLFILLTEPAVTLYNEIEQKIAQGYDDDIVITSLVPSVHSLENSSLYALAFVRKVEVSSQVATETDELAVTIPEFSIDVELDTADSRLSSASPAPTPPETVAQVAVSESSLAPEGAMPSPLPAFLQRSTESERSSPPVASPSSTPPRPSLADRVSSLRQGFTRLLARTPRPFSKDVYVTSMSHRQALRRVVLWALPVLVIVGGAGYYLYQRQTARAQVTQQLDGFVAQAQTVKAEAATDPVGARDKMQQVLDQMRELKVTATPRYGVPTLIDSRINEVQQEYDAISGLEERDTLEQFFDLRIIISDFIANRIALTDDGLVILDREKKQIIALSLPEKVPTTIAATERESLKDVGSAGETTTVLADGVFLFENNALTSEALIANDDQVKSASAMLVFNEAYYVLSPEKQNIFRYREDEEGNYDTAVGWVRPGEAIDFNQVQSWAIDGDIWIGTKDGKIIRYNSGRQVEYQVTGLNEPFAHPLLLATSDQLEKVYVLEANNKRLVVLSKDGAFLKEIKSSSLATATGVAISADETRAYVISGSLVYAVPL